MKTFAKLPFSLLAAAVVASSAVFAAQAQTVINGVTITKPGKTSTAPERRTVPAFVDESIPADWVDVRGRISTSSGNRVNLPAGSKVNINLRDITNPKSAKTLVSVDFAASRMPVSYQLVSSPRRFTSTGVYTVQVNINNAAGKLIYTNVARYRINPAAKRILADVKVTAQ